MVTDVQCFHRLFVHKHIRQYSLTASHMPGANLHADVGLPEFGFPGSYFTVILHLSQHEALYMSQFVCHTLLPAPLPHQMTRCDKQEWISLSIILQNSVAQSHTTFSNNIC